MKNEIIRGNGVVHNITEVFGYVTAISENINGNVQCLVQRPGVDNEGKTRESKWTDLDNLKVDTRDDSKESKPAVDTNIKLGDEVKHYSGFTGIAYEKATYLNGCVHFGVMPKAKDKNEYPKATFVECQSLTVVKALKTKVKKDDTGGPSTNAPARE